MVQIKYVGKHQPYGMIIDIDDDRVKEFLKSSDYESLTEKKKTPIKEVKEDDNTITRV